VFACFLHTGARHLEGTNGFMTRTVPNDMVWYSEKFDHQTILTVGMRTGASQKSNVIEVIEREGKARRSRSNTNNFQGGSFISGNGAEHNSIKRKVWLLKPCKHARNSVNVCHVESQEYPETGPQPHSVAVRGWYCQDQLDGLSGLRKRFNNKM